MMYNRLDRSLGLMIHNIVLYHLGGSGGMIKRRVARRPSRILFVALLVQVAQALKRGPAPQRLWSEPIQGLSLHPLAYDQGLLIPSSPSSLSPSIALIEPKTGRTLSSIGFDSPGPVGIAMHTSKQGSATAYVVDTTALIAVDVGTMTVSWIFRAPEGALLDLAPAVDPTGELVYVGDNSVPQGNLYAIRPPLVAAIGLNQERVGEVVWNVTIPAGLAAPPLGVDGGVVVQANSGTYRLLSRIDGRTIWAKNFGYPTALAPILRSDGEALLIKTGIEGELQALSLANGSALWDQSAVHVMRASDSTNTTFVTEKRAPGERSTYNALPLTLARLKSERHESRFGVVLLAVTGLGQYFGPQEGQHGHIKAAVAAHHDGTGEELWRVLLPESTMVPLTPPLLNKRGTICFIATSDQHIYGLDSRSGHILWEEDVDDGPLVSIAYVDDCDEDEDCGGTLFYLTLEAAHGISIPPGLQGEEDERGEEK